MFQVKARTSTVVIGEHVLHADRPVHYPDSVPPEVAARTDLVEITELLEADGVAHAGDTAGTNATGDAGIAGADTAVGEPAADLSSPLDTSVSGALDDAALAGVTLLHVEGDEEDEDAGADPLQPPDPFADEATGALAEQPSPARKTTRTASGGRR
jgi:hypothetical protein